MFDFVRKHTRIMQFLLFLLIFPSFVLFGVQSYSKFREKGDAVASVDGHEIMQGDWDDAHRREADRIRQQMPSIDAKLLDTPAAKYGSLETLVRDRVLAMTTTKQRLTLTDAQLARELQDNPMIASLRRPDGSIDMKRYRDLAASQGLTPEGFEARMRSELSTRQVIKGVAGTNLVYGVAADVANSALHQQREIQVQPFMTSAYLSKVKPSDADVEAFYKDNAAMFQSPETADIEYIVLDQETVRRSVTVNEADLKTYYEQNQDRLAGKEERRASHILITAGKDDKAAREAAKAKAAGILTAVKAAPASFADQARKNSQDPGSAAKGGDLDFFARGAMVKPFEEAVFAMKAGEISDLVESDFGYHIIQLTDVKKPKARSFEEMRPELEDDMRRQLAQRKFPEMAELMANMVYEQADSLKPTAEKLKLEIRTASGLHRTAPPQSKALLDAPKFLEALFSADVTEKKHNTQAVELPGGKMVAARMVKYAPAATKPLADVKAQVVERVTAKQAAALAAKDGAAQLAAQQAKAGAEGTGDKLVVSRQQNQKLPGLVVEAALRADPAKLPVWLGVDLGVQGYAVVKVNQVLPAATVDDKQRDAERNQYNQAWSGAENLAYYNLLKERLKVKMLVSDPATKKP